MEIKEINTAPPDYILQFIDNHTEQLIEIYNNGYKENGPGCLGLNCSNKENTMDVFFMNETMILQIIPSYKWDEIKEKKLNTLIVKDIDLSNIFIINN